MTASRWALASAEPRRWLTWAPLLLVVGFVAAASVVGGVRPLAAMLVLGFAVSVVLGLRDWRLPALGLLLYLPLSGLPALAAHGDGAQRGLALLAKDFLFVIPLYLAYLVHRRSRGRPLLFEGFPLTLVGLFSALVVLHALNPGLPNLTVGLIGIKVWLFYLPMVVIGYHLVATRLALGRLLAVMSLGAVIPAAVGIVSAVMIYAGHEALVYRAYGDAAAAATQEFVALQIPGGGTIRRIPSVFTYGIQFYLFLATMLVVSFSWWRLSGARRGILQQAGPVAIWLLVLTATFLSGQRGAFIFVPLLFALVLLFSPRVDARTSFALLLAPVPIALGAMLGLGANPRGLFLHIADLIHVNFTYLVVQGFGEAVRLTWFGLGTGTNTHGSRHAFPAEALFTAAGGKLYEGWYIKAYLELGLVGLVLLIGLLGAFLLRGLRAHRSLQDRQLQVVSAVLLAFLVWNLLYGIKAQFVDLDPLNVYFWLLVGVLLKLPALDHVVGERASPGSTPEVAP